MSTFREYIDGDVVGNANPFSRRDVAGEVEWPNPDKLKLIFKRFSVDDGSLRLKVKTGFKITLKLSTQDFNGFRKVFNSFDAQNYPESHISHYNTGIGGDSVLTLSMWAGDWIEISDGGGISLNLRRDASVDSGSWLTNDSLSTTADIKIKLKEVIRYTETTGDWEGEFWNPEAPEESDEVVIDDADPLGLDDTPIDEDYHPIYDDALILDDPDSEGFVKGWTVLAITGVLIYTGVIG